MVCIRASLQRFLTLNNSTSNIISGEDFKKANLMLKCMIGKYLKSPNRSLPDEKFPPIEEDDMIKLRAYFDRSSPDRLQDEFIFNTLYFFGLRGRETLRELRKNSFAVEKDGQNRRYIRLVKNFNSKTCKASTKAKEFENAKNVRMYESTRPEECPVECFEAYLAKLPSETEELFLKPILRPKNENAWYCKSQTLGHNTLGNTMANLSKKCSLSKRYTNHSVRVTTVGVLREQGFSNEEIAPVTGHKNVASVQRYAKKRKDDSHFIISEALQAGSSKSICQKVIPVGSGKIKIEENRKNCEVNACLSSKDFSQISVHFSGVFNNTTINFQKSDI